jgi:iron(III) transport system substrate-binding protein
VKRIVIIIALIVIIALPFVLRPKRTVAARADDTVVIITPHNEAIRSEYARGFAQWYRARTRRTVAVDWRVIGGTSDITRFLASEYLAAFRIFWTGKLGQPWSVEVQAAFTDARLAAEAPAMAHEARKAFLTSDVGCGIDVFFGGGSYDFVGEAQAGRIVPSRVRRTHPEWFTDAVIPQRFTGEQYWDEEGCWVGNVISSYGILYNADVLARLKLAPPQAWSDLTDPRYVGTLALADPTKSSSMAKAFENIIQQQIQERLAALRAPPGGSDDSRLETRAVNEGWLAGMRLIQLLAANARYFTDASQKPPIDIAQGDCAAGICIDFYGRAQAEAVEKRGAARLGFVTPHGGTINSVDPIALLRGAPHREAAELFIEYTLTLDGQKLWNFKPGAAGGPVRYALRRLPARRDFYEHAEWKPFLSDPEAAPFSDPNPLIYHPAWTSGLFDELRLATRVMGLDNHRELVVAWRAILAAPEPARSRALAELQDLSAVDYGRVNGEIKKTLRSKNKVDEVRLASELAAEFRRRYARAEAIARGGN